MSKVRDIARFLGKTEASNTTNARLLTVGEGGLDSATADPVIEAAAGTIDYYTSLDSLPTTNLVANTRALVESNQRYYISNGSGWYNVALVNLSPRWDSIPNNSYDIVDSATPLIITAKALDSDNSDNNLLHQSFVSDSAAFLVDITRDSSVYTFTPKSQDSIGASVTSGDLTDSNTNDFIYTFKWSDGINFVSKAVTINYNFDTSLPLSDLRAASTYQIGTTGLTYNSSTKKIGTHSGYVAGAGSINRRPGYNQGSATSESYSAYTISMWVNVATFNATYNSAFFWNMNDKSSASNSFGGCAAFMKSDGLFEFCTNKYTSNTYSGITTDVGTFSTGTWYHIVATANNFPGQTPSLWVSQNSFGDKANLSGYSNNSGRLMTGTTTTNLLIGNSSSNAWYLHGTVGNAADNSNVYYDDVRIYFGKATAAQAEGIYNSNGDPTLNNGQPGSLRYMYTFDNTNLNYSV